MAGILCRLRGIFKGIAPAPERRVTERRVTVADK